MSEQLEIPLARALPPDPGVADLEGWLAEAPSWLSAEDIAAATRWDDRRIRDLASESDLVISSPGKRGYRHIRHVTAEEYHRYRNARRSQARKMVGQGHPHRPHLLPPPDGHAMNRLLRILLLWLIGTERGQTASLHDDTATLPDRAPHLGEFAHQAGVMFVAGHWEKAVEVDHCLEGTMERLPHVSLHEETVFEPKILAFARKLHRPVTLVRVDTYTDAAKLTPKHERFLVNTQTLLDAGHSQLVPGYPVRQFLSVEITHLLDCIRQSPNACLHCADFAPFGQEGAQP